MTVSQLLSLLERGIGHRLRPTGRTFFLHEGCQSPAFCRSKCLQPKLRKTVRQLFSAFEVGIGQGVRSAAHSVLEFGFTWNTNNSYDGLGLHALVRHERYYVWGMDAIWRSRTMDALAMGCSENRNLVGNEGSLTENPKAVSEP